MPEEVCRLPGSSYQELTKIIKAYGNHSAEAVPSDVSKLAAIHPTVVSRNNAFLVAIDVLKGGKKKLITDRGRALARALEQDLVTLAAPLLQVATLLNPTWMLSLVV